MSEKRSGEPEVMLEMARSLASKLRFSESLHWYRTYLCRCRGAVAIQSEMHQVQQTESEFEAAKETIQFVGEVCSAFALDFVQLREDSGALVGLVTTGPAQDAIMAGKQLMAHVEKALRARMDLEVGDVWAESAHRAAKEENYRLALRLAERSERAPRLQALYLLLCQAEDWLNCISYEASSLQELDNAESLRQAMKKRDPLEIRNCISSFFDNDGRDGDDSPSSGVPTRPQPPNLPANEKRDKPHSPPPA